MATVVGSNTDVSAGRRRGQLWRDEQVIACFDHPRELAQRLRIDALKSLGQTEQGQISP